MLAFIQKLEVWVTRGACQITSALPSPLDSTLFGVVNVPPLVAKPTVTPATGVFPFNTVTVAFTKFSG